MYGKKVYISPPAEHAMSMIARARRAILFALYQLTIMVGIVAMPMALTARQAGVTLPIHRLIETVGGAYENASPDGR